LAVGPAEETAAELEELQLRAELARVTLENEQLLANLSYQRVRGARRARRARRTRRGAASVRRRPCD